MWSCHRFFVLIMVLKVRKSWLTASMSANLAADFLASTKIVERCASRLVQSIQNSFKYKNISTFLYQHYHIKNVPILFFKTGMMHNKFSKTIKILVQNLQQNYMTLCWKSFGIWNSRNCKDSWTCTCCTEMWQMQYSRPFHSCQQVDVVCCQLLSSLR